MAYGFMQDVPANEEMYREIRDRLGEDRPDRLVAHVRQGLRYVNICALRHGTGWRAAASSEHGVASYGLPHVDDHRVRRRRHMASGLAV